MQAHNADEDDCAATLRMLHYHDIQGSTFPSNYWRAAPHADFDTITLLFQRPGQGGLEVSALPNLPSRSLCHPWLGTGHGLMLMSVLQDPAGLSSAVNIGRHVSGPWTCNVYQPCKCWLGHDHFNRTMLAAESSTGLLYCCARL